MRITELIEELEHIQDHYGDLEVKTTEYAPSGQGIYNNIYRAKVRDVRDGRLVDRMVMLEE